MSDKVPLKALTPEAQLEAIEAALEVTAQMIDLILGMTPVGWEQNLTPFARQTVERWASYRGFQGPAL